MRKQQIFTIYALLILWISNIPVMSQITDRGRPDEWNNLIKGARFLDRFLPMPDGNISSNIWGTDSVQNRYIDNGIELSDISFWGGNIIKNKEGDYHLFVCGWPENSPKGHMFWYNSTVFHAVSQYAHGPYILQNSIGRGHNPEAFRLKDGRIVVYVIDGYYIADDVNGIWKYGLFDFQPRGWDIIEGMSNLTFAKRQDDSYLMVCRGGGVWISQDGISPYKQISKKSIYPSLEGEFEDPVIWKDSIQYHLIVNDWLGRIAYYLRSKDGMHWVTEPGEAYVPGIAKHKDGTTEHWFKYERPKVLLDQWGRVEQMNFAVIDTLKWEDLPNDRHSSKNICIPMKKDLLISILNKDSITLSTREIKIKISAEPDFNPQTDLDLKSLRFGSYTEVNYGRGCKPVKVQKDKDDLIVTFKGKGHGINKDEFAPKLIGKDKNGEMVFGYAKLPYVNYCPPMLSASRPIYDHATKEFKVEVENFGLSVSQVQNIQIMIGTNAIGHTTIQPLHPYESITLTIKPQKELEEIPDNKTIDVNIY